MNTHNTTHFPPCSAPCAECAGVGQTRGEKYAGLLAAVDQSIAQHKAAIELLEKLKKGYAQREAREYLEAIRGKQKFFRADTFHNRGEKPKCTHHEFYCQFVTPEIVRLVVDRFGLDRLREEYSRDQHLNGIDIRSWDGIGAGIPKGQKIPFMMSQLHPVPLPMFCGAGNSWSDCTSTLKTAARMAIFAEGCAVEVVNDLQKSAN